ncbi:hypothetical protein AgCh_015746 [Apium graveolens]
MEGEPLLATNETLSSSSSSLSILRWEGVVREIKKVSYITMPMVVTAVSQNLLAVISMMMIGHLGELALSSAAIATSLANVTGFSLMVGMASALETLCGQAYGAQQYHMIGTYTYAAIISLLFVCIPVSILWCFTEKLLTVVGQDPLISHEAGIYTRWLIPALFPYAILQLLVRFLLTQSLLYPMLLSSVAALIFHIPMCWMLIFKFDFGSAGAALSLGLSCWFNVIMLGIYVKYTSSCEKTRISFSKNVFSCIREFFWFGIPSAVMLCLEWWSYELAILLSGRLPNPQLETSVLSICFVVFSLHFNIPNSFAAGASTRVSNELGAGHPEAARLAAWVAAFLAVVEVVIASIILFSCSGKRVGFCFKLEREGPLDRFSYRFIAAELHAYADYILHRLEKAGLIGKAQGFYVWSSGDGFSQKLAFTVMFESGAYMDSLCLFGVHRSSDCCHGMEAKKEQPSAAASTPVSTSCRKKKSEEATFLEDVKDHIDEFIHASMEEHATCFKKTVKKMFGMSKIVAERNSESKKVESSLPLRTTVAD